MVVVYREFSVLLWSKALVLELDQAEQFVYQSYVKDVVNLCLIAVTELPDSRAYWTVFRSGK